VVEAFALSDKYGGDAFRYFVMREMTFGLDADFSEEAFVGRLNADLANDLGNLVARATTLIVNYQREAGPPEAAGPDEAAIREAAATARRAVGAAMQEFAFQRALAALWEFIGGVNRYVDSNQPWSLAKDASRRPRLDRVLVTLADALGYLGVMLEAFLPEAAAKIRAAIGHTASPRLADAEIGRLERLPAVQKLSGLFPRVETKDAAGAPVDQSATTKPSRAPQSAPASAAEPAGPATIGDFRRIDLRVAEVLAAEALPKSKKLLKLTVSLGQEQRTILAGIAQHYAPADLVGKKVVVVANLEPAKLMGQESQGMVLAGSTDDDGALAVIVLDRDLPPGAKVR
jgi:methionyl-tRNA synthetase